MKLVTRNSPHTVLILRSHDVMHRPYDSVLHTSGCHVKWFTNAESLLKHPQDKEPSVVVVDLDLFPQNEETQLERFHRAFSTSHVIALSSINSAQLAVRCLRSGVSDYLLKPVSPEELSWSVQQCFQHQHVLQRLDSRTDLLRAISQITASHSDDAVMTTTLVLLKQLLGAERALWLKWEIPLERWVIKATSHKLTQESDATLALPALTRKVHPGSYRVFHSASTGKRKIVFSGKYDTSCVIFLWGIDSRLGIRALSYASAVFEQGELSLANLRKLAQIKQQTFIDDLTGLYNSRYLKYALSTAIHQCKKNNTSFSVLFIDIDHFKKVNDGKGHLVGSELLVAIAKTIKNAVRSIDPVFRYGGDEFVVLLQGTGLEGAVAIGERIRRGVERRIFVIEQNRLQTTVSIGVATYPEHAKSKETLLRLADEAMYSAKKLSRNAVHLAYGLATQTATSKTLAQTN